MPAWPSALPALLPWLPHLSAQGTRAVPSLGTACSTGWGHRHGTHLVAGAGCGCCMLGACATGAGGHGCGRGGASLPSCSGAMLSCGAGEAAGSGGQAKEAGRAGAGGPAGCCLGAGT